MLCDLPLETLEMVLMRAFLVMYGKSCISERQAFTVLASVCWNWWLTLTGWPQSGTPHWVRHKLRKMLESEFSVFTVSI